LYEAKQKVLEDLRTGFTRLDRDLVERIRSSGGRQGPDKAASEALLQELTALFTAKLAVL
jgi:hypothetical protein